MKWILIGLVVLLVVLALALRTRRRRGSGIRLDHAGHPEDPRIAQGEAMSHLHRNQQNSGPGAL